MKSQTRKQAIPICILPNIWRSKANQIMKFGQLRELNMRNIFHEKPRTRYGGETILWKTFLKNQNLAYRWISSLKVYKVKVCFDCMPSWGLLKDIKTNHRPLAIMLSKAFLKKGLELVFLPHFLHDIWRKEVLLSYSINWPYYFIVCLPLLREILCYLHIVVVC